MSVRLRGHGNRSSSRSKIRGSDAGDWVRIMGEGIACCDTYAGRYGGGGGKSVFRGDVRRFCIVWWQWRR